AAAPGRTLLVCGGTTQARRISITGTLSWSRRTRPRGSGFDAGQQPRVGCALSVDVLEPPGDTCRLVSREDRVVRPGGDPGHSHLERRIAVAMPSDVGEIV